MSLPTRGFHSLLIQEPDLGGSVPGQVSVYVSDLSEDEPIKAADVIL